MVEGADFCVAAFQPLESAIHSRPCVFVKFHHDEVFYLRVNDAGDAWSLTACEDGEAACEKQTALGATCSVIGLC